MRDISSPLPVDNGAALRAVLPVDPARPVLSALNEACVVRWITFQELVVRTAAKSPSDPVEEIARLKAAVKTIEEWFELLRWVLPNAEPLSQQKANELAEHLISSKVVPISEALELAHRLTRRRRGAPAKRRDDVIAAYEAKLATRKTSWNELAQQFCDCGQGRHDFRCQETLRKGVNHLKKVLRKYQISPT